MNEYPGATWYSSPNYGYPQGVQGRNGYTPVAIITHIAEGTRSGCISWFLNPASEVSAHYFVCADGSVVQFVKEGNAAWSNGVNYAAGYDRYRSDLSIPWIKECWDKRISPNLQTLSIELEGYTGRPLPSAQVQSWLNLCIYLGKKYNIPRTPQAMTGHFSLDAVTRARCPGSAIPWTALHYSLNVEKLRTYPDWALLRLQANEEPRDYDAFVKHLRDSERDYRFPRDYGWPA